MEHRQRSARFGAEPCSGAQMFDDPAQNPRRTVQDRGVGKACRGVACLPPPAPQVTCAVIGGRSARSKPRHSRDNIFTANRGLRGTLEARRYDDAFLGDYGYWEGSASVVAFAPVGPGALGFRGKGMRPAGSTVAPSRRANA